METEGSDFRELSEQKTDFDAATCSSLGKRRPLSSPPSSPPHKKRRVPSQEGDTTVVRARPGLLAKHWGVMPHHMDYKNKVPKVWLISEQGDRLLSPWALAWFDDEPRRIHVFPEEYRQVYLASHGKPRVKFFVNAKISRIYSIHLREQYLRSEHRKAATEGIKSDEEPRGHRLLYPARPQPVQGSRPTASGVHLVSGREKIPDNDFDTPLPAYACHGGNAPLLPQQSEPRHDSNSAIIRRTKSRIGMPNREGMPLWACLVDYQYRPKPWGHAERMPEDYYRARFRVEPNGHLPSNVIPNNASQTAAMLVNQEMAPSTGSSSILATSPPDLTLQAAALQAATSGPTVLQTESATPARLHSLSTKTQLPLPSPSTLSTQLVVPGPLNVLPEPAISAPRAASPLLDRAPTSKDHEVVATTVSISTAPSRGESWLLDEDNPS